MFQYFKQKLHSSAMEAETIKNAASPKSQMSRRNFLNYLPIVPLAVSAAFTSCGGGGGIGKSSGKIKMTTEQDDDFSFYLGGSGTATVDWGDGSEKVTLTLNANEFNPFQTEFRHTYPNATIRTITINGDNITGLYSRDIVTSLDVSHCVELTNLSWHSSKIASLDLSKNTALTYLSVHNSRLTSLDVSKNIALTYLNVMGGQLTSLDVSKNTALTLLDIRGNQLTTSTLNALFGTLHNNAGEKYINIFDKPETSDCDRSIAERKGWRVQ